MTVDQYVRTKLDNPEFIALQPNRELRENMLISNYYTNTKRELKSKKNVHNTFKSNN